MKPQLCIHTESSNYGGAEVYLLRLMQEIKFHFNITFVCPENQDSRYLKELLKIISENQLCFFKKSYTSRFLTYLRLFRDHKFFTIFLNDVSPNASKLFSLCALMFSACSNICSVQHLSIGQKSRYPGLEFIRKNISRMFFHFFTKIIVLSHVQKKYFISYYGVNAKKIEVIHNSVPDYVFDKLTDPKLVRQILNLEEKSLIITLIGRLTEQKGHKYLLEAIHNLPGSIACNVNILFIGEGELEDTIKKRIRELQIKIPVHFLGFRKNAIEILNATDIIVLPSISEGFPFVLLEGMNLSKPCIASDVGGVRELIKNNQTGILIEPRNINQIKEALTALINSPEKRTFLGSQGKKWVTENFNFQQMIGKTTRVLNAQN